MGGFTCQRPLDKSQGFGLLVVLLHQTRSGVQGKDAGGHVSRGGESQDGESVPRLVGIRTRTARLMSRLRVGLRDDRTVVIGA